MVQPQNGLTRRVSFGFRQWVVSTQQGIAELGRTNQMYAIAEVYETDIVKVRPGQQAIVTSEYGGFGGEIQGKVDSKIGRDVVDIIQRLAKEEGCSVLLVTHDNRILDIAVDAFAQRVPLGLSGLSPDIALFIWKMVAYNGNEK